MAKNKITYDELARAKSAKNRVIVISECSKGGFTIAQQLSVCEDGKENTTVFMKGALHVESIESMENLRDALNISIEKANAHVNNEENGDWD